VADLVDGCHVLRRPEGDDALDAHEARAAEVIAAASDLGSLSDELDTAAAGWEERQHLAVSRANVLRALRIPQGASVLEVGAGSGALTRYLGERCAAVDAVEPSLARARVARRRTRGLPSVEVFVGELADVPAEPAYDLVMVTDLLDPAGSSVLVHELSTRLRPGGTLLLAGDNRFGVRYLAGAPDERTGAAWDSLDDYPHGAFGRPLSRRQVSDLMRVAGLESRVLFAFPDHRLTRVVFGEELLEELPSLAWRIPQFPSATRPGAHAHAASERALWRVMVQSGAGAEGANAFVVLATKGGPASALWPADQLAVFYQPTRRVRYATETRVVRSDGDVVFRRAQLAPASEMAGPLRIDVSDVRWFAGSDFLEVAESCNDAELAALLLRWEAMLDLEAPAASVDLVPHNLIVQDGGQLVMIDREWQHAGYTREDVIRRGVLLLALHLTERTPPERWSGKTVEDVARHLGNMVGDACSGDWLDDTVVREAKLQLEATLFTPRKGRRPLDDYAEILWDRLHQPLCDTELGRRDHQRAAELSVVAAAANGKLELVTAELTLTHAHANNLATEVNRLRAEVLRADQAAAEAQRQVDALVQSRSWRATAPLRSAARSANRARERLQEKRPDSTD
jgi:SAM-dependent methyltransferase